MSQKIKKAGVKNPRLTKLQKLEQTLKDLKKDIRKGQKHLREAKESMEFYESRVENLARYLDNLKEGVRQTSASLAKLAAKDKR